MLNTNTEKNEYYFLKNEFESPLLQKVIPINYKNKNQELKMGFVYVYQKTI